MASFSVLIASVLRRALKKAGVGGVIEDLVYLGDNCWLLANQTDYECPKCGSTVWVSYSNKSGVPDGKNIQLTHGNIPKEPEVDPVSLTFMKYIAGEPFMFWARAAGFDAGEIAAMMSFELYAARKTAGEMEITGPRLASAVLGAFSSFTFWAEFKTGWYAVVEVLTGEGRAFFSAPEPLYIYIEVFDGVADIKDSTGGTGGGLIVTDFDYEAFYTIINGYGWSYGPDYLRNLGYPGLNNGGDIFYIGITNAATGQTYASYCAHAGSRNFAGDNHLGCGGYLVANNDYIEEKAKSAFISAFNYIEDNYGDLNGGRHITQAVVWALLGAVDVNSEAFEATNLTAAQKAAVKDVMQNYEGYIGNRTIIDAVYLLCEIHEDDFEYCQPQILPIYAKVIFENTLIA